MLSLSGAQPVRRRGSSSGSCLRTVLAAREAAHHVVEARAMSAHAEALEAVLVLQVWEWGGVEHAVWLCVWYSAVHRFGAADGGTDGAAGTKFNVNMVEAGSGDSLLDSATEQPLTATHIPHLPSHRLSRCTACCMRQWVSRRVSLPPWTRRQGERPQQRWRHSLVLCLCWRSPGNACQHTRLRYSTLHSPPLPSSFPHRLWQSS